MGNLWRYYFEDLLNGKTRGVEGSQYDQDAGQNKNTAEKEELPSNDEVEV